MLAVPRAPSNRVPGHASGSKALQPTSEQQALTGRGQGTNHLLTLGSFHTQESSVPFPELVWSILIPFHQVSSLPGPFPGLTSWLTGLATFFYQTKSDYGECYWKLVRRAKHPGVATTALDKIKEDSTTGETVGKTAVASSCP